MSFASLSLYLVVGYVAIIFAVAIYSALKNKRKIITISGPLGSGKSSILKCLLESNKNFKLIPITTKRDRSLKDLPGEFQYVSEIEFEELGRRLSFVTTFYLRGNWYGVTKENIDRALRSKYPSFLILPPNIISEISEYVKKVHGERSVLPLFISTEDKISRERLKYRGESEDDIEAAMSDYKKVGTQVKCSGVLFAFIKNNDSLDQTISSAMAAIGPVEE